jgi:purine-nucleoside phosphorylase
MTEFEKLQETETFLRSKGILAPEVGIVLGTGLSNLTREIDVIVELAYQEIPHFPTATVEFHLGKLIYGTLGGKRVVAMQGRFHYYEGYTMNQIVFPIRVMKLLGVSYVLLSNAAGSVNPDFKKGGLMLIDDHINLQPENPLRGPNINELGGRFPDMSRPYTRSINACFREVAAKHSIALHEGVYVSVPGPNLETRAEYRFMRAIGADAVGMSTVPEVIACNHMELPCAAVSVLTDECDPDHLEPVDIAEILAVAAKAEIKLTTLFKGCIESYSAQTGS